MFHEKITSVTLVRVVLSQIIGDKLDRLRRFLFGALGHSFEKQWHHSLVHVCLLREIATSIGAWRLLDNHLDRLLGGCSAAVFRSLLFRRSFGFGCGLTCGWVHGQVGHFLHGDGVKLGTRWVVDLGADHDAVVLAGELCDACIECLVVGLGVTHEDGQDALAGPLWLA